MKKKIKDVAFGEVSRECIKYKLCIDCPLRFNERCIISYLDFGSIPHEWPEDELGVLEKEVEIE